MLFEAFKKNREERADEPAFLIPSGDRYFPIDWKRFTDDIALVSWIIEKYTPGSKIALLGENSYEWMVVHAATLFTGAVAVPVDPNLNADDIAFRLRKVGAAVLLHSSLYAEKAHAVAERMPGLATGGFGTRKTDPYLMAARAAIKFGFHSIWKRQAVDTERTSMIVFTSGTTSEPRGVELSIQCLEAFCDSTSRALPLESGKNSLMLLPLHHIYGISATYYLLVNCVACGVCPDFRRIYDAFERFRVSYAFLVPALAEILAGKIALKSKSAEEAFGQSIEWIMTGGAPISRRAYEKLTGLGIPVLAIYGLTETCACYSMSKLGDAPHPCSAGRVSMSPDIETKVSDSGELLIRGPNVMKGYYRERGRTAQAIDAEGWYHTGDVGRIDADGYVWITGRLSRTIILDSGKKVAPEEMEEKILQLPGIDEVLVSGNVETREIIAEVYALVSEETVRKLIAELNRTLPVYQRIKTVRTRREPFERTSSGKIKLG